VTSGTRHPRGAPVESEETGNFSTTKTVIAYMNEYLNAKSMVTPGVAGGLVMAITNTCANQFDLAPKWTALALSALLGLFVVGILAAPLWQKGLLWILNALVIFSMAMGTNQAGATLQDQSKHVSGPYPTPSASPVITQSPSASTTAAPTASPVITRSPLPNASTTPAPTPHKIDPRALMQIQKSFFNKW
jgi:phosphotransferase system  glucose/maltose/N-acetylglucosamine-specific IIC component